MIRRFAVWVLFTAFSQTFGAAVGVPPKFESMPPDSFPDVLWRSGFWEARVDSVRGDTAFVTLGRPAVVERVEVACDTPQCALPPEAIIVERGDTLVWSLVEAQQEEIVSALEDRGYPFASCSTAVDLCGKSADDAIPVCVRFVVEQGHFVVLERLAAQVEGRTKPRVIAWGMLFKPKTVYRQSHIERGASRLRRMGIVSLVGEPYPALDAGGAWTLVVRCRDLPATSISGVVGYSEGGLSGDVEFNSRNLAGTGRRAKFYLSAAEGAKTISVYYLEPFVGALNVSPELSSEWAIYDSTYLRREHSAGVVLPVSFSLDGSFSIVCSRTVPGRAGYAVDNAESFGASAGLAVSTLNDPVLPTRGVMLEASCAAELIHRWGRSDELSLGIHGEGRLVAAIPAQRISLWIKGYAAGWLYPLLPPKSDWEHIGGWRTLRGYRERQFAGCRVACASVEVRLVPKRGVHLFPFVDLGAYGTGSGWSLKLGYGVGVEYRYGAGAFSLSYGLGEGRSPKQGLVHFGIRMEM